MTQIVNEIAHRKFSRIKSSHLVNVHFTEKSYTNCRLKDISLVGMFIEGTFSSKIDKNCLVSLDLSHRPEEPGINALARVVRITEEGLALEFVEMTLESYAILQAFLLYETDQHLEIMLELPEDCPFTIIEQSPGPL